MNLAPIVLFVFNRPYHTRQTLEALAANELAAQSTLYIYSDGPRYGSFDEDMRRIAEIRSFIREKAWCGNVHVVEVNSNRGLAASIVSGVTEIVNRHDRVIVLEDDIVTQPGFLRFMNEALELYDEVECVMHISGMIYGTPESVPALGTSFLRILSCHGWATWSRAWNRYCHDIDALIDGLRSQNITPEQFDIEGHGTFYAQLLANKAGKINTWAVRWYASWLLAGGYSLFPHRSLLTNIGHDGSGTHTSASFYNGATVSSLEVARIEVRENVVLRREMDDIWRRGQAAAKSLRAQQSSSWGRRLLPRSLAQVQRIARRLLPLLYPPVRALDRDEEQYSIEPSSLVRSTISTKTKLYRPHHIWDVSIGDYSYVSRNAWISQTRIGKFCSIGPNLLCGWGRHPVDGISTSPMFYSTERQNGVTLCDRDKYAERCPINIGNDVFIGMNVTILDGVNIGNGAVIGAGTVVSKDVPPYAIMVGNPIRILRYRFSEETIQKLLEIAWWDWPDDMLQHVEQLFLDPEAFVSEFWNESVRPTT